MISSRPDRIVDLPAVLCVSEDKAFLNTMRISLGQAGFVVVATASSAEALELADQSPYDAMIFDYALSQIDGIALFEQIAGLLSEHTPPTLIAAEHYAAPLLARCVKSGTAGLHAKSDPAESLVDRVIGMLVDDTKRQRVAESASRRVVKGGVDTLTRIASKEHFIRRLSAESVASYREGNDLSLLLFDVDRYDRIEERYGRQKAENLLAQIALMVEGELRSRDCVARFAEHSFGVILPESGLDAAAAVGRRLRATVAATEFGDLDHPIAITISAGAACRRSGMQASPEEMISLARKNCEAACQLGGDRFVADAALTGKPVAVLVATPGEVAAQLHAGLEQCGVEPRHVESGEEAIKLLTELPAALIIAVHPLPVAGHDILAWARERQPTARRVLVADESAVGLMSYAVNRAAIHHFVALPWRAADLLDMVDRLVFS